MLNVIRIFYERYPNTDLNRRFYETRPNYAILVHSLTISSIRLKRNHNFSRLKLYIALTEFPETTIEQKYIAKIRK
jgi:hypothetical protein